GSCTVGREGRSAVRTNGFGLHERTPQGGDGNGTRSRGRRNRLPCRVKGYYDPALGPAARRRKAVEVMRTRGVAAASPRCHRPRPGAECKEKVSRRQAASRTGAHITRAVSSS